MFVAKNVKTILTFLELKMIGNEVLIKGGHVVDPVTGIDGCADILIENGKIKAVSLKEAKLNDIVVNSHTKVINATSKHIIPGLIDCHTHIREPGLEYKEDIETGSRAAAKWEKKKKKKK